MKKFLVLIVLAVMSSCNVISMVSGEKTNLDAGFFDDAFAASTPSPPIMLGYGPSVSPTSSQCMGADYPTDFAVMGAGFTQGTILHIYAQYGYDGTDWVTTPLSTPVKVSVNQFTDQGEVHFDLTGLPTLDMSERFIFKLVNPSGAFSKGSSYYIECGP